MKPEQIIVPVAALVIGGALGYCLKPVPVPVSDNEPAIRTEVKEVRLGLDSSASADALRRQIRDLQRQLAEARAADGDDETAVDEQRRGRRPHSERADRGGRNGNDWMERMRAENPEQYANLTNRFAQMRRQSQERTQSKLEFFNAIDTARMSPGDREVTRTLQNLLVKREELMARMQAEGLSGDDRRQIGEELRTMEGRIHEASGQVREALIKQTAETLGYSGEAVGEIAGTIMEVIEMTEAGGPPPGGPGGFGRGGRGGFPGGGRGGRR